MKRILPLFSLMICSTLYGQNNDHIKEPPTWAKSAVWYELFVERFYNGNPSNDPTIADINVPSWLNHLKGGR